jgi:son of sevenless-like protein
MLMTQNPISAFQNQQRTNPLRPRSEAAIAQQALRQNATAGPVKDRDPSYSPDPMNGFSTAAPAGAMYVRALYNYDADDRTSLSFNEGDVIQVITQLESGWWDGVINGVRGWFPSNYCQVITGDDSPDATQQNGGHLHIEEEQEEQEPYDEESFDEADGSDHDDTSGLPLEGTNGAEKSSADYWIPQATPDGRLYYFNTMTGESSMELPLESPSSVNETGPPDTVNIQVPDRTRPPPTGAFRRDEDAESEANSISEMEGEDILMASKGSLSRDSRAFARDGISPAVSMESINGQAPKPRGLQRYDTFGSMALSQAPNVPSTTSFTSQPFNLPTAAMMSRSFFDEGSTTPLSWSRLVNNMRNAIERYREAITNNSRSEYVARAEDVSDHLRLLLAAGSGTTDNHSGQPSIISTNKALYPHFRDMMSKFSKLVISSHIAAADWPNAESVQKCLQEADGVLLGVFNYVEVAKQQRGEGIPRLFPGFIMGTYTGGSWLNNGLAPRDPVAPNFLDDDEGAVEPTATLDKNLLGRLDELKRMLVSSIRELDKNLVVLDKIITPYKHEIIGNNVCSAGGKVLEIFKSWIAVIESIDLSSLGNSLQTPLLADFSMYKQSLYDNMSDLVLGCQAVAGPLADEWSEVRGEALESRLEYVRTCAKALEQNSSQVVFSLPLLMEQAQFNQQQLAEPRYAEETAQNGRRPFALPMHGRSQSQSASRAAPQPPPVMDDSEASMRPKGDRDKITRILGEGAVGVDEQPLYLRLDYERDIVWENKPPIPPTVKGGSLLALVEQLTRHDKLETSFNNTFLLTYRSFTTARELFELLVRRFTIQPPEGLTQADYEAWRDRKQKPIRLRVVNILKTWFDNYWMEDPTDESKQIIRDVYTFARDTVKSTETPGHAQLMAVLDQRLSGKEANNKRFIPTVNQSTPNPIMPKNMKKLKFLDIDVTEFARQLTIIESRLYGKIKPTECLNKTWQKKVAEGQPEPAPNVKALILHSNQMTNWVAEMILAQSDVKKRVVVIKHFVAVADVRHPSCIAPTVAVSALTDRCSPALLCRNAAA